MSKIRSKVRFFLSNMTNNRPLCFLSTVAGLRDLLIGIGFVLGLDEITQTRIYQNYDELVPGISGIITGIMFILVGLVVSVTAATDVTRWTRLGLRFQAFAWLFSTLMYAFHGDFVLAAIFGIFFSVPSGYIAYYYKYVSLWDEQKEKMREELRQILAG